MIEDLLKPSLSKTLQQEKMYSLQSHFLVAFFGGPIAIALFSMWSLHRISFLNRLLFFQLLIATVALVSTAIFTILARNGFVLTQDPATTARLSLRVIAMMLFGVIYAKQRNYFNVSNFDERPNPSPWIPGICTILLAIVIQWIGSMILIVILDL